MFDVTEEQKMIMDMVQKLGKEKLAPLVDQIEETDEFSWDVVNLLGENGLLRIVLPEKYGGINANTTTLCMVIEELSRLCPPAGGVMVGTQVILNIILARGNEEQKERIFSHVAKNNVVGSIAITEPNYGSNAANMQTKAVLDGDTYILNGTKCFISNGSVADYCIVFARTGPGEKAKGISAFILEKDTPGFTIGKKEKKMGMRGSPMAELIFEDARVPKANLLMNEGDGWKILMEDGNMMRVWGTGMSALAIAQRALDYAKEYAKERTQFGSPIAMFQAIQFKLADMAIEIEAARSLIYRIAAMIDRGDTNFKKIEAMVAMAKCFASDVAMRVTTEAVQVYGGYGYMKDYPVERLMRDAKGAQIADGTNEIQRMIVSRYVLLS
ncbi:MAG: acyl-CoA dehydrogenase family protein [Thermodesulfobacteriota bacterium]|nr:acyl-CoA dehydrogenase family protein [Thermodesulfobacteriota bacterium]